MLNNITFGKMDFAKYPFLNETGDYVRRLNIKLEDFAQHDYQAIIERAEQRVFEAVLHGKVSGDFGEPDIEILSFPLALIIVKASGLEHLMLRYSYAEAMRVEKFLEEERKYIITNIFSKVLNIDLREVTSETLRENFDFLIHVTEYLKRAPSLNSLEWKLNNRVVDHGYVYLKIQDLVRLIREEIRRIIYIKLKELSVPALPSTIEESVKKIRTLSPPYVTFKESVEVSPENYPPCVKHILNLIQKGDNITHYGRFLLTTYLLSVGKSIDDVLTIYPKLPDFRESLTRYQVEHIAGLRGGRVRYKVPTCGTISTHNLCFKDIKLCNNIKSPLQFNKKYEKYKKGKIK